MLCAVLCGLGCLYQSRRQQNVVVVGTSQQTGERVVVGQEALPGLQLSGGPSAPAQPQTHSNEPQQPVQGYPVFGAAEQKV